jgi:ABC-type lipoprotein release transport system permease subunit
MTVEDINAKDNNVLKSVEPGFSVQVEFEGYDPQISPFGPPGIFAYGYDVTSERPAFKFTIDKGEKLTPENEAEGIIFASGLANNMNKKVGDHVVMRVPGKTRQFTIVGISEFPLDQVWVGWKALAEIADYTYDTITSESPLPAGAIPAEASDIIKYATLLQVEGYETSGPMPGVLALGFTPKIIPYLTFDEGSFPNAGETGLVITKAMAEKGGYSVGDQINIASEVDGGQSGSYTITGIFDPPALMGSAGGGAMSAQAAIPGDWIGMFWRDLATMDNASVESRLTPQLYFINTIYKDPSVDQMDNLVDKINDKMVTSGIPIFALNFVQLTQMISDGFFTIQAILSAVALLIALVGALGLLTTLSMSVYERQKEIGVMRSIGAGSSTVAIQFLTEGLVVGFVSWLVGLIWMVIIQKLLLQIIGPELFSFEIVPAAIISGFIGMMVITTIASLWPSIAASRKTVSDILRYQ